MGVGKFIHHIGTILLLIATGLLIVVTISAPVVNKLALLNVELGSQAKGAHVTFGTFGYCLLGDGAKDACTNSRIGYNPAQFLEVVDGTSFSDAAGTTSKALTRVMVLHPVALVFTFLAFLVCIGSGVVTSLIGSLLALVAFIVSLVALVCDFVAFSIIRHDVNDNSNGSKATYGAAIWCMLAATVLILFAALIIFVTCCAGRRKHKRETRTKENWTDSPTHKRRFWQRRTRY